MVYAQRSFPEAKTHRDWIQVYTAIIKKNRALLCKTVFKWRKPLYMEQIQNMGY